MSGQESDEARQRIIANPPDGLTRDELRYVLDRARRLVLEKWDGMQGVNE